MNVAIGRTARLTAILATLAVVTASSVTTIAAERGGASIDLNAIGQPGPQAIKFKIWTNKEEGEAFRSGDRAIIFLTAEHQAYVTVLSTSSDGAVTLVLPNSLMQDNMVQPNKLYALFGDDAPVRLTTGKKSGRNQLVLFVSSKPFVPAPLVIPKAARWLTVKGDAGNDMEILREKLSTLAKDEGFNKATLLLPGEAGENLEIKLTEVPRSPLKKGIPGGLESSVPETLTGSPGLKPLRKGNIKQ